MAPWLLSFTESGVIVSILVLETKINLFSKYITLNLANCTTTLNLQNRKEPPASLMSSTYLKANRNAF